MIPARIEQFLKTLPEPDFFIGKNRAAADEIHDLLRQYVDQGTATIAVNVEVELLQQVDAVLRSLGWTAEEGLRLYVAIRRVIHDDLHYRRYPRRCIPLC